VKFSAALVAVAAAVLLAAPASATTENGPTRADSAAIRYQNCKALNKRWPHGVGRWGARDRTSGTPVTNFKRSNRLYRQNSHLDRDNDKIACEKK
jgi:Excalibur calcium-binding domain